MGFFWVVIYMKKLIYIYNIKIIRKMILYEVEIGVIGYVIVFWKVDSIFYIMENCFVIFK